MSSQTIVLPQKARRAGPLFRSLRLDNEFLVGWVVGEGIRHRTGAPCIHRRLGRAVNAIKMGREVSWPTCAAQSRP
jgi:hypothetical protein